MKLNKKFVYASIASILAISPMLPAVMPSNTEVLAAKTDTLTLNHNSYVYTAQGKRTYYNGKGTLRMGTTVNGNAKTTSINGKSYYPLTGGAYVKAANVGVVNKQVQSGNLELNYNSYVYDKNGKRLYKFRGSKKNTHLRKGTPLKYSGSVEKIDRNSKQYFLVNDDNYNQSWLPYEKIGGKYYYNIGAGGYVNAANIGNIDNKPLYVAEATVTISPKDIDSKGVQIGLGKEQITVKPLQKIKVNRETLFRYDPTSSPSYIISGTKTGWFPKSYVQKEPRQRLLTFTADTYVLITAGTDIFDANGDLRPNQVDKAGLTTFIEGEKIPVDELLYIWSNKDNKAELYYHLGDVNGFTHTNFEENNEEHMSFIKAADSKYVSGPFLKPLNTVDEAKADAKVATAADKKDLQKEIDQENAVHNTDGYKFYHFNFYDDALKRAKEINSSDKATVSEVKEATRRLQMKAKLAYLTVDEYAAYSNSRNSMPEEY